MSSEEPKKDLGYWLSRPMHERVAEVERLRRDAYSPAYDALQFEKVGHFIRLGENDDVLRADDE